MNLRNLFSRRMGTILVLSTLPGQGQEADSLKDPLWSSQEKVELLDPPVTLDPPWAPLPSPLEKPILEDPALGEPAMRDPAFSDKALLVTPHDAVLMGQEPEVAYRKVQRLMAQRPMADNPAGVDGLGQALLHDARKLLHAIQEEHPEWKPDLIAREIAETDRRLERLRREARGRFKAAPPDRSRRDRFQTKLLEPLPSPQTPGASPPPPAADKSPPAGPENREVDELRRQLHQTEQALQESRRREEALRTVVRDLISQMDGPKPSPSGPPPPPRPVPFRPFPPPPSPDGPPPPPPVH